MARLLGEKLRHLRMQRGATQHELAALLGMSRSALTNIERGQRVPHLINLLRIAQTLRVSADYLLRDSIPVEPSVHSVLTPQHDDATLLHTFGSKLRALREQGGLNQTELSQALALRSQSHISAMEAGKTVPSVDHIVRIADFFHVSTDILVFDDRALDLS